MGQRSKPVEKCDRPAALLPFRTIWRMCPLQDEGLFTMMEIDFFNPERRDVSMKQDVSRILVETVVRKTLRELQENPERQIRNLIDMALQFSGSGFKQRFFSAAQAMLQNENSPYYKMIRDNIRCIDQQRLLTFSMNVGYNGCVAGAKQIRENEIKWNCNIPWTICFQISQDSWERHREEYHRIISEGEKLGIYSWMIFIKEPFAAMLELFSTHLDSGFFLFTETADFSEEVLDDLCEFHNLMLVLPFDENDRASYEKFRQLGLLYSVFIKYSQQDLESIINGDLVYAAQQMNPLFTVLAAEADCPDVIRRLVYQETERSRCEQRYHTILWELHYSNQSIDSIISSDACSAYFDVEGNLCEWNGAISAAEQNLFENELLSVLQKAFPKKTEDGSWKESELLT